MLYSPIMSSEIILKRIRFVYINRIVRKLNESQLLHLEFYEPLARRADSAKVLDI